ncbi:MAG: hypothetical protein M0Q13_15040 [Methanothrix sp.]|jgi:hypothetical protein|nr:hypothetical protein [Methanothrix sp.]
MNKERYFELKNLEENKNLSDDEFYYKYKSEFNGKTNYSENRVIDNIYSFKDKMQNIKSNLEKKVTIL